MNFDESRALAAETERNHSALVKFYGAEKASQIIEERDTRPKTLRPTLPVSRATRSAKALGEIAGAPYLATPAGEALAYDMARSIIDDPDALASYAVGLLDQPPAVAAILDRYLADAAAAADREVSR